MSLHYDKEKLLISLSFFLVTLMAGAVWAWGSTVWGLSVGDLTQKAEVIASGRVIGQEVRWEAQGRHIETASRLLVNEQLKGPPLDELIVVQPGGKLGDWRSRVPGVRLLKPAEEVLLFLSRRPDKHWRVLGLSQGLFTVRYDAQYGGRTLVNDVRGLVLKIDHWCGPDEFCLVQPGKPVLFNEREFLADVRRLLDVLDRSLSPGPGEGVVPEAAVAAGIELR